MLEEENPTRKPLPKWLIGVLVLLGLAFIGTILNLSSEKPAQTTRQSRPATNNTTEINSLRQEVESLKTERDAAIAKAAEASSTLANLQAELDAKRAEESQAEAEKAKTTFSVGTYLVGTDIPPGRYKGTTKGGTAYWQISGDANGSNIIANNNTEGDFYVQVTAGQYLEINRAEITLVQ